MAHIIKDRSVVTDPWLRLELNSDGSFPSAPSSRDIIVPLAMWRGQRTHLLVRPGRLGVWLDSHEEPTAIAEDLRLFGVVAVNFPQMGDGRGYSTGRLLRERYGWRGELRAVGDIFRDQLLFLARCGFDAFALREGEDPQEALAGLSDFIESYQGTVGQPLPLYRRRHATSVDGMERS